MDSTGHGAAHVSLAVRGQTVLMANTHLADLPLSDHSSPSDDPSQWEGEAADGLVARRGGIWGVVATGVMTGPDRRQGSGADAGSTPALRSRGPAARDHRPRTLGSSAERTATIAHYAFGGVAGAIYGVVGPRRARPAGGVAYAGAIWAISFLGVFPRVGLMPRPSRDDTGRQVILAADHLVYGLTLDALLGIADRLAAD